MKPERLLLLILFVLILGFISVQPASAQATISTGSIQGVVTDPNGAVLPNTPVTITNKATGQTLKLTTSGSGAYSSGPLQPGNYEVRIEGKGFSTQVMQLAVQVGVTSNGNAKLTVGKATETVEVTASGVAINTEQPTVQGVLTTQQIENLPINGRNFLDLAQLEPGVQIQDGGNFDPTKNGFSSISFGGRFGRTARIEVDGIDISDETVGTTTQNLPASAIQEFQVSQSSLDMSTELTSSGAVNVVTRSGSNRWHGEGFYLFRDSSVAADIANTKLPFQRNNFGGNLGGYLIKDKLFFFADAERLKQDLQNPVATGGPFAGLSGAFNSPFHETMGVAKLDWKITDNSHMFYRFSYEQNHSIRGFIQNSYQPFLNQNNTPSHVVGWDLTQGSFTHQVRFGWMKFRNGIGDATTNLSGSSNPAPNISLTIGPDPFCLTGGQDIFCSGPNLLAPQKTFQENTQIKYDGSKTWGSHIIRYGFGYNHIQGGGFAKFFALAPTVNSDASSFIPGSPFPGGASNPLNYGIGLVVMGNGQGFSSEKPAFGLPGGGLGPDNRIQWYIGDNWKFRPNLTLLYGVRYVHDTGRTDSDIGPLPCNTIDQTGTFLDPAIAAAALAQCGTSILDLWGQGLGKTVRTPGHNFGPQVGFAWSPGSSGKTVIRGGVGLYYENSIFNNNLFNRPGRLQQGLFLNEAVPCAGGGPNPNFVMPDGSPIPINLAVVCGEPIGTAAASLAQLQAAYQAATINAGPAANGAYIGNTLAAGGGIDGINLFAPNYQTPRSVQMNIGFQHELGKGVVLSADYIRNVGTHTLLAVDVNHVGDVRFFNKTNAINAITATTSGFGCAGGASPAAIDCAIAAGASIADFAGNGLDSGTSLCGGFSCPTAAFPGQNPILGVNQMLFPSGRSVYNGFDTSLKANVNNPFAGVKALYWQVSYSLSRYVASALDSDFINTAVDNNNPTAFLGPNGLDRTHQISFGGTFDFPGYIRFGIVSHVYSPLAVSMTLPGGGPIPGVSPFGGPGGIFTSDVTGDGSGDGSGVYPVGDLVPGTKIGSFGRDVKTGDLASFIANYNATQAGQATPAGQVLIQNGLFTLQQLQALGGVLPALAAPPPGEVGLGWLKTFDFRLSYPRKIRESFTIEPSVSVFNAFNNANFDLPGNTLNGILNIASQPCDPNAIGAPNCNGSINSTTAATRTTRVTPGSGVFDLGAPRVFEFGLKLSF